MDAAILECGPQQRIRHSLNSSDPQATSFATSGSDVLTSDEQMPCNGTVKWVHVILICRGEEQSQHGIDGVTVAYAQNRLWPASSGQDTAHAIVLGTTGASNFSIDVLEPVQ